MKPAVVRTFAMIAIMLAMPAIVGAYAIDGNQPPMSGVGSVNLPQVPANLFNNINWTSFINTLPVQGFVSSLQSGAGSINANGLNANTFSMPNLGPATGSGSAVLAQIDTWTQQHLGFRISVIILAILGIFSWVLNIVLAVIDWLIKFLR